MDPRIHGFNRTAPVVRGFRRWRRQRRQRSPADDRCDPLRPSRRVPPLALGAGGGVRAGPRKPAVGGARSGAGTLLAEVGVGADGEDGPAPEAGPAPLLLFRQAADWWQTPRDSHGAPRLVDA
ncbi:hypothetical protein GCM10010433_15880 [Streptomyces pulveraceus]